MQAIATRALCDQCLNMPVAVSGTQAHPYLRADGDYVKTQDEKVEKKVRCTTCHAIWLHRKCKWGNCEGYRLHP